MSHQDHGSVDGPMQHRALRSAVEWLAGTSCWKGTQFRDRCPWRPQTLVAAALVWAWSQETGLVDRFQAARRIIATAFEVQQELAGSYQAFTKMLARWTKRLLPELVRLFRGRMQQELKEMFLVSGRAVFGIDGSRLELPRTRSNEAEYAPGRPLAQRYRSRKGPRPAAAIKKGQVPQAWLTVLWHVGSRLPWAWRQGRADASERDHLRQMIPELPDHSLITADAGFVGYEYWQTLLAAGHDLLIRVGANVKLLRELGYVRERQGVVYLWPDRIAVRGRPPLVLRLVVLQGPRHPVYLVTSILDPRELSDAQLLALYRRRWGVEVFYRSFKQTFQRRKLRSQAARHVELELVWSLVGLWAICLLAQHHQQPNSAEDVRTSVAQALRAIRGCLREFACPVEEGRALADLLAAAVCDHYRRAAKASRDYPRKKREHPPGPPQIHQATTKQIIAAKKLKQISSENG